MKFNFFSKILAISLSVLIFYAPVGAFPGGGGGHGGGFGGGHGGGFGGGHGGGFGGGHFGGRGGGFGGGQFGGRGGGFSGGHVRGHGGGFGGELRGGSGGHRGGIGREGYRDRTGGNYKYRKGGGEHHDWEGHKHYPKRWRYYGWYGAPYFYFDTYPYYYGDCAWLYRKAVVTGSPYWWRRYYWCVGY